MTEQSDNPFFAAWKARPPSIAWWWLPSDMRLMSDVDADGPMTYRAERDRKRARRRNKRVEVSGSD